jgi:hypothetical protein
MGCPAFQPQGDFSSGGRRGVTKPLKTLVNVVLSKRDGRPVADAGFGRLCKSLAIDLGGPKGAFDQMFPTEPVRGSGGGVNDYSNSRFFD